MVVPAGCSRILAPHRAIGLVCDGETPFAIQSLGGEPFVTVSVGHAFQVFSVEHLRVVAVSARMPRSISALASHKDRTFVACGRAVHVWERMHPLAPLGRHPKGKVAALLLLGGGDLLASLSDHGGLRVWDLKHASLVGRKHRQHKDLQVALLTGDKEGEDENEDEEEKGEGHISGGPLLLAMDDLGEGFEHPSAVIHPETYLNKVLVGSKEGSLGLFNIRAGKRVHVFNALPSRGGGVTALEPSPALDVCAVGMGNGAVHLMHLRQDVVLFSFTHESPSPVTALSFRTDGGVWALSNNAGGSGGSVATLVSGQSDGRVWVWGLEEKKLLGEVNAPLGAHAPASKVLSLCFLPREPVLLSLGSDNALKAWIFDGQSGPSGLSGALGKSKAGAGCAGARLLRSREGHARPPAPRAVRWYHGGGNGGGSGVLASAGHGDDATSLQLLSGSTDRSLRAFHAVRDALSCELSQGKVLAKARRLCVNPAELKLRPVVSLASCEARARDWCDVVTAHKDDACVYAWRFQSRSLGPHELKQPHWKVSNMGSEQDPANFATCVCVSVCGSFALVGTAGGVTYRYNLQSGQPRGAYPFAAFKPKLNFRKIEAGDVRLTVKKMKKATQGPNGPLRNASGAFVHGKKGVGYRSAVDGGGMEDDDEEDDDNEEEEDDVEGGGGGEAKKLRAARVALALEAVEQQAEAAAESLEQAFAYSSEAGHSGRVTGVAVDALNHVLLTTSLDGTLRFWSFTAQGLSIRKRAGEGGDGGLPRYHRSDAIKQVGSPVGLMEMVRDAGLVACGCDDKAVRVFDVESRRLVRRLTHHQPPLRPLAPALLPAPGTSGKGGGGPLTDLAFSPDARRLYTTSTDGTLRVWDLPSGKCVDWVCFSPSVANAFRRSKTNKKNEKGKAKQQGMTDDNAEEEEEDADEDDDDQVGLGPATSVSVCPTGEFVCTSHAGDRGLHLWSDRTLYDHTVRLDREPSRPTLVSAPSGSADTGQPQQQAKSGGDQANAKAGVGFFTGEAGEDDEAEKKVSTTTTTTAQEVSDDDDDDDYFGCDGGSGGGAGGSRLDAPPSSSPLLVTLSGVPRSRWESLFNLELVRARNRPIAPVAAPPQAPFFLPTLRAGESGLDPSFGAGSASGTTSFAAVAAANQPPPPPKPSTPDDGGGDDGGDDDAGAAAGGAAGGDSNGGKLVAWGDAWSDDDDDGADAASNDGGEGQGGAVGNAAARAVAAAVAKGEDAGLAASGKGQGPGGPGGGGGEGQAIRGSRLLRRTKPLELPRSKLAEMLLSLRRNGGEENADDDADDNDKDDAVMEFLKALTPSAVDVELTSLCRGEPTDEQGLKLLCSFLGWCGAAVAKGQDFELLQAYLHRTLAVHAEVIASDPAGPGGELAGAVREACAAQQRASAHVRDLLQKNLCLIQFFSDTQPF